MPLLQQVRSSSLSHGPDKRAVEHCPKLLGESFQNGRNQGSLLLLPSLLELRRCPLRCYCDGMVYPGSLFSPVRDSPVSWLSCAHSLTQKGWPRSNERASLVDQSACNEGDQGSIPRLGRSPGKGNSNPLQYSCLENAMDRGAWWATVNGVTKSQTRLSMHASNQQRMNE